MDNYLKVLEDKRIPTNNDIVESYKTSLKDAGLSPDVAFDAAWESATGNNYRAGVLGMDPGRISPSPNEYPGIDGDRAREVIVNDFLDTVVDVWNQRGFEGWCEAALDLFGDTWKAYMDEIGEEIDDFLDQFLDQAAKDFLDFAFELGDFIRGIEDAVADFFDQAKDWVRPRDPLVQCGNAWGSWCRRWCSAR